MTTPLPSQRSQVARTWLFTSTLAAIVLNLGACASEVEDVTELPQFRSAVTSTWCLSEDAFAIRLTNDQTVYVVLAGYSSLVPRNMNDYLESPSNWHQLPQYRHIFDKPYRVARAEIVQPLSKGTAFRVRRVIRKIHPELGTTYHPILHFKTSAPSDIDGALLFPSHKNPQQVFENVKGVTLCP